MNILNRINSTFLSDKKFLSKIRYNKQGYYVHQKTQRKDFKVSIIIPVFNAEETIEQTIDSITNQSIGFENIEVLLIDDMSSDSSREIIMQYAKEYNNISPIFLAENTGSPGFPRNLGIDLANGKYITFIDSDDWLAKDGIKVLYDLLETSGNNYAIGKTIKVTDKSQQIIGEYNNWANRKSINPIRIENIFQHLGPTARLMRTSLLQDENIKFPNEKFAEDKRFFIDVLIRCPKISTTKAIVYYANRMSDNKGLTTRTDIFEKTDANIRLIKYVINKKLPIEIEKRILNRLYEFDCITRLFNRKHFLVSNNKEKYFEKFKQVLDTTTGLRYNFEDNFNHDWHKLLVSFFNKQQFNKLIALIDWSYNAFNKEISIKSNLPYYCITLESEIYLARIDMYAQFVTSHIESDNISIKYNIYGDYVDLLNSLVIRERHNELNEIEFPIRHKSDNLYETVIPFEHISKLEKASYGVYIKYDGYKKVFIKMNTRSIFDYNKRRIDFYTTIADNYGLNIK